jgi:hypothetical protein
MARAVGDQFRRRRVQLWPDQRFVGEYAPSRQVYDRLEDHPESLVAKGLLEGGRRSWIRVPRFHEANLAGVW